MFTGHNDMFGKVVNGFSKKSLTTDRRMNADACSRERGFPRNAKRSGKASTMVGLGQGRQPQFTVVVVEIDLLAVIAAGHDVVKRVGE